MNQFFLKTTSRVTIIAFYCLFLYGFLDNLKGATLPDLLAGSHFSYSQGGAILQGAYLGFLLSTLLTGFVLQRYAHREILLFATALAFFGIISYTVFPKFYGLLVSMVVIGLSLGFLDLIGVRLIIDFNSVNTGRLLNLSAFFHGLASTIAPAFAGVLMSAGLHWQSVYRISLVLVAIFLALLIKAGIPPINKAPTGPNKSIKVFFSALRERKAWPYYLMIMSYESIEIGFAVWINEYLQTARNFPASVGISFLSLFFLCLMLGRFLGSFIVEKIGYLRMVVSASLLVAICISIGIFGPDNLLLLLPLSGLFLSVIFPTITAAASKDLLDTNAMSLSLLFTFAGFGGMAGSWIIGAIADFAGLQTGFAFMIIMAITVAALAALRLLGSKKDSERIIREDYG